MIHTYTAVFPQVYLFHVPKRSNVVVVATASHERIPGGVIEARMRALKVRVGRDLAQLEPMRPFLEVKPKVLNVPLLTDDYAPVDALRYRDADG